MHANKYPFNLRFNIKYLNLRIFSVLKTTYGLVLYGSQFWSTWIWSINICKFPNMNNYFILITILPIEKACLVMLDIPRLILDQIRTVLYTVPFLRIPSHRANTHQPSPHIRTKVTNIPLTLNETRIHTPPQPPFLLFVCLFDFISAFTSII